MLTDAEQSLSNAFKAMSAEALRSNNQNFLQLATASLEKFQEKAKSDLVAREKAVDSLVQPIREAVFAVEEVRSTKSRRAHASRTWQSIKKHGILPTVERVVARTKETEGYSSLVAAGMDDFTFEAVVLRHPALFAPETVERAGERTYN